MDTKRQKAVIEFCFALYKTVTKAFNLMKTAYSSVFLICSKGFEWFLWFQKGRTSLDDDPRKGRLPLPFFPFSSDFSIAEALLYIPLTNTVHRPHGL